ncbi:glycogen debranching enzyme isoform X3 [Daktulosphaira vitifoliae]|uniref:glycogen debranching enzyme isoform X3 n=1 Tax=Daktulosphaira vitifoliae TaxID=58002 RepID=UPI0021A98C8E|nr:glycogen debranching enzyme isoform X3 [Daktulosphaira vitifoliae]
MGGQATKISRSSSTTTTPDQNLNPENNDLINDQENRAGTLETSENPSSIPTQAGCTNLYCNRLEIVAEEELFSTSNTSKDSSGEEVFEDATSINVLEPIKDSANAFKQSSDISVVSPSVVSIDNTLLDFEVVHNTKLSHEKSMEIIQPCNNHTRILTLEANHHLENTLYRLNKGWYLEFRIGPSLFGKDVILYTNIPSEKKQFNRNIYRRLDWIREWAADEIINDDSSLSCVVLMNQAGSFHYYFEYEGIKKGNGFICVDPSLSTGVKNIPLNSLQVVSMLTKCLGPLSSWKSKLQVAYEAGYNMVHFTPIQELGGSHSSYSLKDQLALNPSFNYNNHKVTFNDIKLIIEEMRNEWNILSICDIVLNHSSNESAWLMEHSECAYNLVNCPYLKPAYLLDYHLYHFSIEVSKGMWELSGIPHIINGEEHLHSIRHALLTNLLPKIKIHELYQANVEKIITEFQEKVRTGPPPTVNKSLNKNEEITLIPDKEFRRLAAIIDMDKALEIYNIYRSDCFDEDTRLQHCSFELKLKLEELNRNVFCVIQAHLEAAINNCIASIRYFRVQPDGPRLSSISSEEPLVPRYFKDFENFSAEEVLYSSNGQFIMAHNGWVMGGDPLKNFAGPNSDTYLRRELIAWGDSVKLRYGDKPEDCPFLWNHMKQYVEQTVNIFDGVRLDNCHSTPLPVAEYLLDAARKIRPDLYVVAELFTNSDATDNLFVNRLGITSLIREAMSAWDSHELGRLVYRYGGDPVGAFIRPQEQHLRPSIAHALFMDQTHDNPSPIEKRSVYDLLPSTALVSMACCASGSNMGYDQLVPHHIDVVSEEREYMDWVDLSVSFKSGIMAGKKALNDLHYELGIQGFDQVFVDQVDSDIVCVTRQNSKTHETVVLMSYTAFTKNQSSPYLPLHKNGLGKGITVDGQVNKILIEAILQKNEENNEEFTKDSNKINGLTDFNLKIKQNISAKDCTMLNIVSTNERSIRFNFTENFKPGSIVVVSIEPHQKTKTAVKQLLSNIDLVQAVSRLTLIDMNYVLFRCAEEDDGNIYNVPQFGNLVYCGIQGLISIFDEVAPNIDLGHPLCTNLRNGCWLVDYVSKRLKKKEFENTPLYQFGDFLEIFLQPIKNLPSYLVPCYFELVIRKVYNALLYHTWSLMHSDIKNGSLFCKSLALASIQFVGIVNSSPLPSLSPNLLAPMLKICVGQDGKVRPYCVSISAGLPHFSTGYMRNWGRDTFISIRGLLLLVGRYDEVKFIILAFGGCLRHGLIPNLLDGGNNPRYNCRDAVWWWLYSIKQYVQTVPGGISILNDPVNRIFPTDDSEPTSIEQPLYDVIQEVMSIHFQGLCFRERNAGITIDAHMKSQGFDNQIGVHPLTGFIFGGNEWNCGTWMDKMGSSDKAGNRGHPATPRDGSAIELVALSKAIVGWLTELNKSNKFKYSGVTRTNKDGSETFWTYEEWNSKIQTNFEAHFWIPIEKINSTQVEPHPELINRRGIYKDTVGASNKWGDYQLRCNYPVAMVVAPELFFPEHARIAIQIASDVLLGPLGIKTLDPTDWAYDGFYNNDNDSADSKVANGYNYHQGPEWIWPVGFLLRAKLIFAIKKQVAVSEVLSILAKHYEHIRTSSWRGLPELTNKDGAFCSGSCPTQAWSVATILEALTAVTNVN